jgi:hypothetical protein
MLTVGKAPVRERWLSVEDSAEDILSILDIQAHDSLVQMAQEIYSIEDWILWDPLLKCFSNKEHYSYHRVNSIFKYSVPSSLLKA